MTSESLSKTKFLRGRDSKSRDVEPSLAEERGQTGRRQTESRREVPVRGGCWRGLGAKPRTLGLKWLAMQVPQEGKDDEREDSGRSRMEGGSKDLKPSIEIRTRHTGHSAWPRMVGEGGWRDSAETRGSRKETVGRIRGRMEKRVGGEGVRCGPQGRR